jgi:hypothetical protein
MNIFSQMRREFASFFYSPIAYVLIAAATVLNGIVFLLVVDFLSDPRAPHGAAMQMFFGGTIFFWIVTMMVTPLITMRTLSEERSSGTLETLLTAPISDLQVVLALLLRLGNRVVQELRRREVGHSLHASYRSVESDGLGPAALSHSSQRSIPARIAGHSESRIENHAVSRFRPFTM